MMTNTDFKIYRFSPINTKAELLVVIDYVAEKMTTLSKKITGYEYPIDCLTIFSHYPNEYEFLKKIALEMGKFHSEANGPYVKLNEPIKLKNSQVDLLRIRKPDPYRLHVGCGDFKVPDYEKFKTEFLDKKPENLRLFKRPDFEMIEFYDPDFDVLAYVISKEL